MFKSLDADADGDVDAQEFWAVVHTKAAIAAEMAVGDAAVAVYPHGIRDNIAIAVPSLCHCCAIAVPLLCHRCAITVPSL